MDVQNTWNTIIPLQKDICIMDIPHTDKVMTIDLRYIVQLFFKAL